MLKSGQKFFTQDFGSVFGYFATSSMKGSTLLWRGSLSYRNQSIDLKTKSVDWFLHDRDLRRERVRYIFFVAQS